MVVSFLESIKYVGHLFPLSFLRIYIGLLFLDLAIGQYDSGFLIQPHLASMINEWIPASDAPEWYKSFLENFVVSNWQLVAYSITYSQFIVAGSFISGFLVRPVSLLGIILSFNYILTSNASMGLMYQLLIALFIMMAWVGAGRCLGVDYFFFKRNRGIWW